MLWSSMERLDVSDGDVCSAGIRGARLEEDWLLCSVVGDEAWLWFDPLPFFDGFGVLFEPPARKRPLL